MAGCSSSGVSMAEAPSTTRSFWQSSSHVPRGHAAAIDASTGQTLSYGELWEAADRVADLVRSDRKGLVFVLCRNDFQTLVGYIGALRSGHAVALIDADTAAISQADLIERYQPEWILGPAEADGYTPIDALIPVLKSFRSPCGAVHPDLALLLTTSGSTGSPKFVRLAYRAIHSNASSIAEYLSLHEGERPITSLPMAYSYGLSVVNSHLHAGATLIMTTQSVTQPDFWRVFERYGCTSFAGVPFQYEVLARLGLDKMRLPSFRTLTQAGGRMPERVRTAVAKIAETMGLRLFIMYGQTEATARMTYLPPDCLRERLGSVGVAIPGGSISIISDQVSTAVAGVTGEVAYRGANVMMGYATCRQDLALADEQQGRLLTGDVGYLDSQGFLFLTGRTKRIAKIHGHRVNLDELEALLVDHGPLAAVAAEESIVLYCEFGGQEEFQILKDILIERLRLHHSVFQFQRVNTLPRTLSGKVDYATLGASK